MYFVFDLGYLGVENDFPAQLSSTYLIEEKKFVAFIPTAKRIQSRSCSKENNNRAYYLQVEKI